MKKALLTKLMLLLCALIAGSSSVWAGEYTYTLSSTDGFYTTSALDTHPSTGSSNILSSFYASDGKQFSATGDVYFNSGYLMAKNGCTITLPTYSGEKITGITLKNSSGCSKTTSVKIKSGNNTAASAQTWSTQSGTYNYTIASNYQATALTVSVSSSNAQIIELTITTEIDNRAETTVTLNAGYSTEVYGNENVTSPTGATVKAGETTVGTTVTWSSSNTSVAKIDAGTGAITLDANGKTTIKASYAGDSNYKPSEASYTLYYGGDYSGIEALQTATGSSPYNNGTGSKAKITFNNNTTVTYVSGDYAYILDAAGKGAVIIEEGHGLTAGKEIAGTVAGATLCKYSNGFYVIKGVKATDLSLSDGTVTTQTPAINNITAANQSMKVKFEDVTYDAANTRFSDGNNTIGYKDQFSINPSLTDGGIYDVTGILVMDGGSAKVAPIANGVVSKKSDPTSQWKNGNDVLTEITIKLAEGNKKYTFQTNSDGAVTYTSTNENVATIANDGTITPVAYGTTTIKASTASTNNYNPDVKTFILNVANEGLDLLTADMIGVTSYTNWTNKTSTTSAVYAGNTTKGNNAIQMRSTNSSGIVTTTSGGRAQTITVAWNANTADDRTIDIYGKYTAYTSSADLYGDNKGTKIGSIVKGTASLTITGNYPYIGIRSNNGALYLDNILVEWDATAQIAPEVTIGAGKYATFSHTAAVDFTNSGMTPYTAKVNGSYVTLTAIEGNIVPANTAVVLGANAAGSYAGLLTTGGSVSNNDLLVSDGSITGGDGIYALASKGNPAVVGFYKVANAVTIPAGKGYLNTNTPAPEFLGFDFNGETTGINEVRGKMEDVSGKVYNLAGQRVAQPTKGLYIVNGKKVVIK